MANSNRAQKALIVLQAGGYFRKQLETTYQGREQFVTRLRRADGTVVPGIGYATFRELEAKLSSRECSSSSVWPTEHALREVAASPQAPQAPACWRCGTVTPETAEHAFCDACRPAAVRALDATIASLEVAQ